MLHSICQQISKTRLWPHDWERSILISIPKKSSTKECANHWAVALISHDSKVMLKIFHARLQHYVNQELQMSKLSLENEKEERSNCQHLLDYRESKGISGKKIYLYFIDFAKAFDRVHHDKLCFPQTVEYQTILPVSWDTCMWVKKKQLEHFMEHLTGSRSRKEYWDSF